MNEEAKMPDCEDGYVTQTITRYDNGGNEQFFLISDGSLFHHDIIHKFCLDDATEVGDVVADTVAIICRPNPCKGKICVRSCCPKGYIFDEELNYCRETTVNETDFKPVFSDSSIVDPSDLHLLHHRPICPNGHKLTLYQGRGTAEVAIDECESIVNQKEYDLKDNGFLSINNRVYNTSAYCLEDTVTKNGDRVTHAQARNNNVIVIAKY